MMPCACASFIGTPKWVLIGRINLLPGPKMEKWPCQKAEKVLPGTCNPGPRDSRGTKLKSLDLKSLDSTEGGAVSGTKALPAPDGPNEGHYCTNSWKRPQMVNATRDGSSDAKWQTCI